LKFHNSITRKLERETKKKRYSRISDQINSGIVPSKRDLEFYERRRINFQKNFEKMKKNSFEKRQQQKKEKIKNINIESFFNIHKDEDDDRICLVEMENNIFFDNKGVQIGNSFYPYCECFECLKKRKTWTIQDIFMF